MAVVSIIFKHPDKVKTNVDTHHGLNNGLAQINETNGLTQMSNSTLQFFVN